MSHDKNLQPGDEGYGEPVFMGAVSLPGGGMVEHDVPKRGTFLSFAQLHATNMVRARRWHEGFDKGEGNWSGADWSNAAAGEMGEAANVVKKLRRLETGHPSVRDPGRNELIGELGEEIADVIIYLDLLATYYGVDIEQEIIDKFNAVSEREDFPEKLKWEG